jgi:hypothetical protein
MSAALELLVLIDELDDVIHNAKPVPLTDQVRIDKETVYATLDRMRELLPEALISARDTENPPESEDAAALTLTPIEVEEAARSLRELAERVKFGGAAFRLESHGIALAELRPARD